LLPKDEAYKKVSKFKPKKFYEIVPQVRDEICCELLMGAKTVKIQLRSAYYNQKLIL
jgi:hypothetical protein